MGSYSDYVFSKGREEGERKGREEGERKGREEGERKGMEACVLGMLSVQVSEDKIMEILKTNFGLRAEQAQDYFAAIVRQQRSMR